MNETTLSEGISRRTVVKGAAWSIPVMAAAVAAPAAVATGGANWDVQVSGECSNDYDLSVLQGLVPPLLLNTVQSALALLGLTPGASRTFTITALEGDVPAGTEFVMSYPNGLIDVSALEGLIEANALFLATVNNTQAIITLQAPLTQGSSVEIDVFDAIIDIGALSTITLSLSGSDNPTDPGAEGADSDSISTLLAAGVNLGSLGILGVSGTLAVQLCA